jgi:hypothetical protein
VVAERVLGRIRAEGTLSALDFKPVQTAPGRPGAGYEASGFTVSW